MPELSIIISTLNRSHYLFPLLKQIFEQSFTDFELWIIDQSEPDKANEHQLTLTTQFGDPRLNYVHIPVKSLPHARNVGLARSSSRFVLFIDDDVILLTNHFLAAHVAAYHDPSVGGVGGRVVERSIRPNAKRTVSEITRGGRTVENLMGHESVRLKSVKGANMSFRAEVFRRVGGFDRNYTGPALLEESDLAARVVRAGWMLQFAPQAELVHLSAPSGGVRVEDAARSEYFRFRSTAYFIMKNRGWRGMTPFLLTFGLIAASRTLRWRTPRLPLHLAGAVRDGLRAAQQGPDQDILVKQPLR